ncbi:MAG: gamma-glutamylcyclotransferase, partial [Candidatus Coatesbacteria bacterium]
MASERDIGAAGAYYRLFVYGTLQNPYYLSLIIGRKADVVPAALQSYEKVVSNLSFPYVVPKDGSAVVGGLVDGLSDAELERADRYEDEGRLYVRNLVTVTLNGESVEAFTYVAGPELLAERIPDGLAVGDRVTEFLREFIEESVEGDKTEPDVVAKLTLRAKRELLGGAMEDLLREMHDRPTMPRVLVKQTLSDGVPSLAPATMPRDILLRLPLGRARPAVSGVSAQLDVAAEAAYGRQGF